MKETKRTTFPGGIHPTDGYDKLLSKENAIIAYVPETVEISMEQSFGGICEPMVAAGDEIKKGQLIGKPVTFTAVNLHASVDGTVLEMKEKENATGRKVFTCKVAVKKNDVSEETKDYQKEIVTITDIEKDAIVQAIKEGGLTGMGGAGFPSHIKYETTKEINTLLINGAECEPFLTCDYRLMLEKPYEIINGVRVLLKASGAKEAVICVEDNKMEGIQSLRDVLTKCEESIRVEVLPTKYPQGGERQLIQSVLGVEVPQGCLPADVAVIVSNLATSKAAADIVLGNKPLMERVVTVSGAVKTPGNYLVPLGTRLDELLKAAGGVTIENNRVILGGPMTGTCVATEWKGEELPTVTKTTSGLIVLDNSEYVESPCIRCGACRQVCPAGLTPFQIDFAYLEEDYDLCETLYASECIACGCCSFTCPARRELTHRVKTARDIVKQRIRERGQK